MLQFENQKKKKTSAKKQSRHLLSIRVSFFHSAMESRDLAQGQPRREGLQKALISVLAQFPLKELSLLSLVKSAS